MRIATARMCALMVLFCCTVAFTLCATAAPFRYKLLGDVPLPACPSRITFSDDGEHVVAENLGGDQCVAVFTDAELNRLYVKRLPGSDAGWGPGSILYPRLPYTRPIILPSYREVAAYENTVLQDPAMAGSLQRLAVAAWSYCSDASYTVLEVDGKPEFAGLEELSHRTREAFAPVQPSRLTEHVLETFRSALDIYFVDEDNKIATHGGYKNRLFLVQGEHKTEVTAPSFEGPLRSFEFDPLGQRVLADIPPGTLIYDHETGLRRVLPGYDVESRTYMKYFFVPGEERLVVRLTAMDESSHFEIAMHLELWDLDGELLAEIPTAVDLGGQEEMLHVGTPARSPWLLAVPLYTVESRENLLRVFKAVRSP